MLKKSSGAQSKISDFWTSGSANKKSHDSTRIGTNGISAVAEKNTNKQTNNAPAYEGWKKSKKNDDSGLKTRKDNVSPHYPIYSGSNEDNRFQHTEEHQFTVRWSSDTLNSNRRYNDSLKIYAPQQQEEEEEVFDEAALEEARARCVSLSERQHEVLRHIMNHKSVFYTGAAGTGKSYVLTILREVMKVTGNSKRIGFTASTGVAACNIEGLTIHAWSGIGVVRDNDLKNPRNIAHKINNNARRRWRETEILVIDEISMLSAEILDLLSYVGCFIRNNSRPFGGIQLVLCGDFFQLPPIGVGKTCKFCFESCVWKTLFDGVSGNAIVLDKVFRQRDGAFRSILNDMRIGVVSQQMDRTLRQKMLDTAAKKVVPSPAFPVSSGAPEIQYTKLFPVNSAVDTMNETENRKLIEKSDDVERYYCIEEEGDREAISNLISSSKVASQLELTIGSQVMLIKNLDTAMGLVNGARGVVSRFISSKSQIHRQRLPVVIFTIKNAIGETDEIVKQIEHQDFDIKDGEKVIASIKQIPLVLAWAISIHKSQGMTIPFLHVSLNGVFEYGQAYVALSRATDLSGLELVGYDARVVRAHPQVKQFYAEMGYSKDSDHHESSTVTIQLGSLIDLYVSSSKEYEEEKKLAEIEETQKWLQPVDPRKRKASTYLSPAQSGWDEPEIAVIENGVAVGDEVSISSSSRIQLAPESQMSPSTAVSPGSSERLSHPVDNNIIVINLNEPEIIVDNKVSQADEDKDTSNTIAPNDKSPSSSENGGEESIKQRIERNKQEAMRKMAEYRKQQHQEAMRLVEQLQTDSKFPV